MTAKIEEVVLNAHPVEAEHLSPHAGESRLGLGARRDVPSRCTHAALRGGQRPAIELAVRRQRQFGERDDGGRDHVIGQRCAAPVGANDPGVGGGGTT